MNTAPRLELRQQQSLVMTQQLQQSIKLLQLSSLELQDFIAEEIEKNPLLQEGEAVTAEGEAASDSATDNAEQDVSQGRDSLLDTQPEDGWESGEWHEHTERAASGGSHHQEEDDFSVAGIIEQTANELPSLHDHLLEHLLFSTEDIAERMIGRHLIDLVDEAGYLPKDYGSVAEVLQCEAEAVERVVALLQRCEPAGLCARNLAECLALQLKEKDRFDPAMQRLVENLELLGKSEFEKLALLCEVDRDDFREMVAEIKALNPKPGFQFSHDAAQVVEPDILIRKRKTGWHIELNPRVLPRVLVNQHYFVELNERSHNKEDKKYLSEQFANANWLVKALDQRAKTMLKVAQEIVKQQDSFLKYGVRYLKPLTLREVAEAIEMHESTVSRVTSQKYMATPLGMYELKYFFTSSVQNSDGGIEFSSKAVQFMIQKLIEEEGEDTVLSDDTLAEMLKDQGVDVARRTVAKYRDILRIPSSSERRKQKKNRL
jgi:RNA polymerase sigma-54 factor